MSSDPRHHRTQLGAHFFDRVFSTDTTAVFQSREASLVVQDEVASKSTVLDVFQNTAHSVFGVFCDNFRASDVVTVFSGVGDGVAHVGHTTFVHQVNDQFHFVHTFEVRHFRSITCFDQRFETCLNQCRNTAAQYRLFAEEVGFSFFFERRVDDTRTAVTVGRSVGQRDVARLATGVLRDSDQRRNTAALRVGLTNSMTRRFRRDHDDVEVSTRFDLFEVNIETVSECQCCAFFQVRFDIAVVDLFLIFIRGQNHDNVSAFNGFRYFLDGQTSGFGFCPGRRGLAQCDSNVDTGFFQVVGVRVALRAVAQNGDFLALDERKITILVVVDLHDDCSCLLKLWVRLYG
ncbi:septin family protein [Zymobacter palmae]|uniref:Septin family protein n=1 Tax=Zymobacter palmae TaxID=33074 RepID=A0A348HC60_9GAMM|nr:septin family protein [Zymobacter palmae]